MREIGTLPEEKSASRLADYLLTRSIPTKVVAGKSGWTLWARREEQVEEASRIFSEYVGQPDDLKYVDAAAQAKAIRKQAEKEDALHRKNTRTAAEILAAPLWQRAPVTFAFLTISTVVFFVMSTTGGSQWIRRWWMFSVVGYDPEGFLVDTGLAEVRSGQYWRLVTPIFLHFGILHFAFNMSWLINLGQRIEWVKGRGRLLFLILASGIAGNIAQFYETGGSFGGMSGVVYGLFGYILTSANHTDDARFRLHSNSIMIMLAWFFVGVFTTDPKTHSSWIGPVANSAHGAGLVMGLVLGLLRF